MKKFFIIFFTILIMAIFLVLPSAAAMPSQFGNYANQLHDYNVVNLTFHSSPGTSSFEPFYYAFLKPNTTYTFISTRGSDRVYFGPVLNWSGGGTSNIVYGFDCPNIAIIDSYTTNGSSVKGWSNFEVGYQYRFSFDSLSDNDYTIGFFAIDKYTSEPYYFKLDNYTGGSLNHVEFVFEYSNDFVEHYDGSIYVYVQSSSSVEVSSLNLCLTTSEFYEYIPIYSNVYYLDDLTCVYQFTTPSNITGPQVDDTVLMAFGINDSLAGSDESLFSRVQSDDNSFYLVEGLLYPDDISDIISGNQYLDGYNSGYDQGYKEGEFDGLNSTKFMNSTLLTAISAPFVLVSSALNFEIFGINFYHILQVLFTLLLVAFVVTKLKGRE